MPEHHQASDFEMSAKRRQKGKATESPGPSQEFTDEIEEDDRQEAGEETTSPTLGDLAKGHSELAGQVSALASQLELLVNAMASSTVAQTPAAQIKSAVVPPDPEDDEDFEDDSSESTDFELDGTSAAAHSADNPFPRQMRDAAGELVDLRNELTYQEFRRRNTLKGDPRRDVRCGDWRRDPIRHDSRRQAPRLDYALNRVLTRFNLTAPTGCSYSSHSCRKCATLAKACGVMLEDICYWGGWAVRSTAVHAYIELSCRLHGDDLAIAREFFGWLRPPGK